jgi:transposase
MSRNKQRRFTNEFKREAVRLTMTSGRSVERVANDLGNLSRWGLHQGQRSYVSCHQAGHLTAADQTVRREKSACVHICLTRADAGQVFCCKSSVVHMADFTRSAEVVRKTMNGRQPRVWTSDRYSAQQRHGTLHQTCLAHLARDFAYGLEASEDPIPFRLKLWFDRVFAFALDLAGMARSTLRAKKCELERQIDDILMASPSCSIARELLGKIARARDQLLVFCLFPGEVEPTNNGSERALRPAVIQRKVTNGYRVMWAAEYETAVRSTGDTARLAGAGSFQTIPQTIA